MSNKPFSNVTDIIRIHLIYGRQIGKILIVQMSCRQRYVFEFFNFGAVFRQLAVHINGIHLAMIVVVCQRIGVTRKLALQGSQGDSLFPTEHGPIDPQSLVGIGSTCCDKLTEL